MPVNRKTTKTEPVSLVPLLNLVVLLIPMLLATMIPNIHAVSTTIPQPFF